jgi:hypothetical protein
VSVYEWKPVTFDNLDWGKLRTRPEIQAAIDEKIEKAIGDFREILGLPREASAEEIAAANYCHECGRPHDEEKP